MKHPVDIILFLLTACNLKNTDLFVQGVKPEVHGAGQGEGDPDKQGDDAGHGGDQVPDAVQYITIGVDSHIDVRDDYLVLLRLLLIAEKSVRHPYFGRVS